MLLQNIMSTSRSHCRVNTFYILIASVACIFIFYIIQERSYHVIRNEKTKCVTEQTSLLRRLRDEADSKEKAVKEARSLNSVIEGLSKKVEKLQDQLESLKLECSKYEKQAQEEHVELQKHKVSLSESQKQLQSELLFTNEMIGILKRDKKELEEIIKKLKGDHSIHFTYPLPKSIAKNFNKQIDLGDGYYKIAMDRDQMNLRANNAAYVKKVSMSKSQMKLVSDGTGLVSNGSVHSEIVRPHVPYGFAPELIVNDEKHKSGDYIIKPDDVSNEKKSLDIKNADNAPNRYKSKLDGGDGKIEKSPPKKPAEVFHLGEDRNLFDGDDKNHLDDNVNNNYVNINPDQGIGEPGLQSEDDDDFDEIEKSNFNNEAVNMN